MGPCLSAGPSKAGATPHVLWDAAYDMGGTEVRLEFHQSPKAPNFGFANNFLMAVISAVILVIISTIIFVGSCNFFEIGF